MAEQRTDEWGTWERTPGSRNGWFLVPGTQTAMFEAKRVSVATPPPPALDARVFALEAEIAALETEVAALRARP